MVSPHSKGCLQRDAWNEAYWTFPRNCQAHFSHSLWRFGTLQIQSSIRITTIIFTKHIKTPQFLFRGPSFLTLILWWRLFSTWQDCKKSSETKSLGQLGSFDPRVDPRSSQSFHNLTLPVFLLETISRSTRISKSDLPGSWDNVWTGVLRHPRH